MRQRILLDEDAPHQWPAYGKRARRFRSTDDAQEQLRELNKLDNWHGVVALTYDYAVIASAIAMCVFGSWWLYPLTVVVIGSRMRALATLLHESAHGVLAKNTVLNTVLGTACSGYLVLQLYGPYRKSHVNTHHPLLGDPTRDPDLQFFIECGVYEPTLTRRQRLLKLVILPILGGRTLSSVRYLLSNRLVTSDKDQGPTWDRKAFLATWIVLIGILAATGNLSYLPLFWIVPYFTTFQIITWFIELAEHTPLLKHSDHNLYLSRNRKSRGIEWFLTSMHAENYHLDHHLDPRTPFWNMRHALHGNAARRGMGDVYLTDGYLT